MWKLKYNWGWHWYFHIYKHQKCSSGTDNVLQRGRNILKLFSWFFTIFSLCSVPVTVSELSSSRVSFSSDIRKTSGLNILILFNEAVEDTVVLQLRGTDPQHGVTVAGTDSLPFTLSCAAASSGSVPALRVGNGGNLEKDNSWASPDQACDDCVEEEDDAGEPWCGDDHDVARLESIMKVWLLTW